MNEQLKQAIEAKFPEYNDPLRDFNNVNPQRAIGARICLQDPSILRHADPEIMKQAGWVREEDITESNRQHVENLKILQWIMSKSKDFNIWSNKVEILNKRIMRTKNIISKLPQPPKQ